jgi:hypothetical protein
MRLAWCRAATDLSWQMDDTAALVDELRPHHDITVFDSHAMHDLVRLSFRQPFDLHIFELADTDDDEVLWPYAMHYPGVLRLRSRSLHHSRAASLVRQRRGGDRKAELAFGNGDLSAAPIVSSRVVVVADQYRAAALQAGYPAARIRVAPLGQRGPGLPPSPKAAADHRSSQSEGGQTRLNSTASDGFIRIGVLAHPIRHTIVSAAHRASESGARIELMTDTSPDRVLDNSDVVLHLPWPAHDDLAPAIAALAASRPLVIMESESSAGWPSLDPQTWQPRGFDVRDAPIAIAIDPRDEEHSLMLALRRLANDPGLRRGLSSAAHAWWSARATVDRAVTAWQSILHEAAAIAPPPHPRGWPPHLTADGTERARELLGEFAVSVDFLD